MSAYELHWEAEEELYTAAAFYDDLLPGLGSDFLDLFERAIEEILDHPLACRLWPDFPPALKIRRKLMDRFPYGLPFILVADRPIVLAVAHLSREPGYWLSRSRDYLR